MAKPILILQVRPEDETSDNEFEAILKYGGLDKNAVQRTRVEKTGIPADLVLEIYSAVIVGGSPFDLSTPQEQKLPLQMKIEQDFMRLLDEVVRKDFPFLGACSGCGLLGTYLGAPISTKYAESVGSVTLELTEEGKMDPLLSEFPDQDLVLLGHKEACDNTPEGSTLLMRGAACPVQMFRVGRNVYATQFHPEGDPEGFALRINIYKNNGYFRPHEAEALTEKIRDVETPYAQRILKRFVRRYAKS
jgi:GMP synthase (glutamine-hydrolysing)